LTSNHAKHIREEYHSVALKQFLQQCNGWTDETFDVYGGRLLDEQFTSFPWEKRQQYKNIFTTDYRATKENIDIIRI
jgi:hypothetical protein